MITPGSRQSIFETLYVAINAGKTVIAIGGAVIAPLHRGLQWLSATLTRQEVHHATECTRAVKHRPRAPHDLYSLHHRRMQGQRRTHLVMVCDLLTVDQDRSAPGLLAADADTAQAGLTRVSHLNTRHIPQHFRQTRHRGPGQFLLANHTEGSRAIKNTLLRPARRNHHFFQLASRHK